MANDKDVTINIKSTGLKGLRDDLKAAKNEIIDLQNAEVIDPAKIEAAIKRAGQLKDQFNDVNEQIAVFSGGSEFEKIGNGLGLIGIQLASLDFEGAAQSAKVLTSTVKNINPQALSAGLKGLASTVKQLGTAFFEMGLKLLANPIFLLVAVIAAIVVSIVLLKDKVGILGKAFDLMMLPITILIQGLKDLTDWLGLTTFASDEAADKIIANNEKISESLAKQGDVDEKEYARQLAEAKARGEDTFVLEAEINDKLVAIAEKQSAVLYDTYLKSQVKLNNATKDNVEERKKDAQKAYNDYVAAENKILDRQSQRRLFFIKTDKQIEDDRIKALKELTNAQINAMQEGLPKEIAVIRNTYKEKRDAINREIGLDSIARENLLKAAAIREASEVEKVVEKYRKQIEDKRKAIQRKAQDDTIAVMEEGFEKEFAKNRQKLDGDLDELDKSYEELKKLRGNLTDDEINDYKNSRTQLQVIAKQADDKLYNDELERLKELANQKKAERLKEIQDFEEYQKTNRDKIKEILAQSNELIKKSDAEAAKERRSNIIAQYDKARADLKSAMFLELAAFTGNEIEKTKIKAKYAKIRKDLDESEKQAIKDSGEFFSEEAKKAISQATAIADAFSALLGGINALEQQNAQQKVTALEKNLKQQSDLLEAQRQQELSRVGLTEEQKIGINKKYDKLKYQQELVAFNKSEEIKKKAFKKDKDFRIAQAAMATASAAVNALGSVPYPANIVVAGLMAALGAIQIATISKQKYEGGTAPTTPSSIGAGALGGGTDTATPNFQLFGNANRGSEANSSNPVNRRVSDDLNITVDARVSEVELRRVSNRLQRYDDGARL